MNRKLRKIATHEVKHTRRDVKLTKRAKLLRQTQAAEHRLAAKRKKFAAEKQAIKTRKRKRLAITPYSPKQRILLLGEGNFSFARALAIVLASQMRPENKEDDEESEDEDQEEKDYSQLRIVATAYDSEDTTLAKYPDSKKIIQDLRDRGVPVLFNVDATDLPNCVPLISQMNRLDALDAKELREAGDDETEVQSGFDRIVFNFPHTGCGVSDTLKNNRIHQAFITKVCNIAQPLLRDGESELHLTIKVGEPYDSWRVPNLVKQTGMKLKRAHDFYPHLYPGYEHRRTQGNNKLGVAPNEDISVGARTYAFFLPKKET